jgi:acyl carrier protein
MTIEDVIAAVQEETGRDITPETKLDSLGLDSLDFLQLIITVSNRCGSEIHDFVVPRINTVNDLYLAASGQL